MAELLALPPDRERFILTRRLDLNGEGQDTLAEGAAAQGKAKETVRTTPMRALARIREQLVVVTAEKGPAVFPPPRTDPERCRS
jgi:hypothetical protein